MKTKNFIMIFALQLTSLNSYASTIDFFEDGSIDESMIYDFAYTHNDVTVNMLGGEIGWFGVNNTSTLNVYGGVISTIYASNSSMVNLSGGGINTLTYADSSVVYLFVDNIDDVIYSSGWLSGSWQDKTPFNIYLRNSPFPSPRIQIVPEPMTLSLMTFGLFYFRRRTHKFYS